MKALVIFGSVGPRGAGGARLFTYVFAVRGRGKSEAPSPVDSRRTDARRLKRTNRTDSEQVRRGCVLLPTYAVQCSAVHVSYARV